MKHEQVFVASHGLCRQLYGLSEWKDTEHSWYRDWLRKNEWCVIAMGQTDEGTIPAYDIGYLLRRLPKDTRVGYIHPRGKSRLALAEIYQYDQHSSYCELIADGKADTPEDALCLVAIALFQSGRLKRKEP